MRPDGIDMPIIKSISCNISNSSGPIKRQITSKTLHECAYCFSTAYVTPAHRPMSSFIIVLI